MKALRITAITFLCIIIAVIALFVGYEVVGIIANEHAADKQEKALVGILESSHADILDSYTFVGNSSGTGNHVDLLTLFIVRAEDISVIEEVLGEAYEERATFPLEYFTVTPLSQLKNSYDPYARFMEEMAMPEDTENCYLISYCNSAPFSDNIIGH